MGEQSNIYKYRFSEKELAFKSALWKVLCANFFQRYMPEKAAVLDLGAGFCEFINNIKAHRKFAVDVNIDTSRFAEPDVTVYRTSGHSLDMFADSSLDVVFASNFFEHIPSKMEITQILKEVHRILKPGGVFLVLQPNIKYLYADYWDFFDHYTPLSHLSMCEVLRINGFSIVKCLPKFLPYTTKSAMPKAVILVKLYLWLPLVWRLVGRQMFIVAMKKDGETDR
jgi:SAM-dependent methyltransferase